MTGGSVEDGFGKNERAGGGWVAQYFIIETARIIDATGHDAGDDSEAAGVVASILRSGAQCFECSGDRELADGAAAAQTRVRAVRRSCRGCRHASHAQRCGPAGAFEVRNRRFLPAFHHGAKRLHSPASRRNGPDTRNRDFVQWTQGLGRSHGVGLHHDHLRNTRVALEPPKPKELVRAYSKLASVGVRTSWNRQRGSTVSVVVVGGSHCPCNAIRQTSASTAPAAPSRCPMLALVELTRISLTASPAQRLMAAASALSF